MLTDIRGSRELGTAGVEVDFVPAGDAAALTAAIAALLDDPVRRERLGAAASRRAVAHFDQRDIARASVATYWAVARRRGLAWPAVPPEV